MIKGFIEKFMGGEGVLVYEIYQDEDDEHVFMHIMKFKDERAEKIYRNSEE